MTLRSVARSALLLAAGFHTWRLDEGAAHAQLVLAQEGIAKSILGWGLTLLAIVLGLLVVCRPSGRKPPEKL